MSISTDNQKYGILSACFGSIPMVMIQDSAVIILFATLLGCGDMVTMLTTAAPGIMSCLLIIPGAFIAGRVGCKKLISFSSWYGLAMLLLLAASPLLGGWAKYALLFSIFTFCASVAIYFAAWVPLMEKILSPKNRSKFLGKKRFFWRLSSFLFFLAVAAVIGENPLLWQLQCIIAITAIALMARVFYINKIEVKEKKQKCFNIRSSLMRSFSNKPLFGFSVYLSFFYLAANSTIPLAFIFLKKHSSTPDNIIVLISSLIVGGSLLGFLWSGWGRSANNSKMILLTHGVFALINIILFFISGNSVFAVVLISGLLIIYGFFYACVSVVIGSEMMALASPENKAVDIAFVSMMYSIGIGGSRGLTALILGTGILTPKWNLGGLNFSMYHTMFLSYAIAIILTALLLPLVPAISLKNQNI